MPGGVRPERTGKRSLAFSGWHRNYMPSHCYMSDLDVVEYRRGRECVGLVEVKYGNAPLEYSQRKLFTDMADRLQVPLFSANYRYPSDHDPESAGYAGWDAWTFRVEGVNDLAIAKMSELDLRSGSVIPAAAMRDLLSSL